MRCTKIVILNDISCVPYSIYQGTLTAPTCKCIVANCAICSDTFCDRCESTYLLVVSGYSRSCIDSNNQPVGKGLQLDAATAMTIIDECAVSNCKNC